MDENSTPPAGETPPPPPPGSPAGHEPTGEQAGPRLSGSDLRDVARLTRSSTDRHIAGVAGGLARHLDVDPILVRVGFVVLAIFGGAGIFLYGALWLLLPEDREGDRAVVDLDPRNRSLAVLVVGALAALAFFGDVLGFDGDHGGFFFPAIPILIVAGIAFVILRKREWRRQQHLAAGGNAAPWAYAVQPDPASTFHEDVRQNPEKYRDMRSWKMQGDGKSGYRWVRDPRKKGPILFWIALPLIAVALGTLGVIDLAGTHVIPGAYPALALAVIAALLLLGSFWGRAGGLIFLGLLLIPITLATTAADGFDNTVRYTPATVAEIPRDGYHFTDAGEMVIDLSRLSDPENLDGRVIDIDMAVGRTEVIVPRDVDVQATARTHGPGSLEVFGERGAGIDNRLTNTLDVPDQKADVTIDATISVGHITVRSN